MSKSNKPWPDPLKCFGYLPNIVISDWIAQYSIVWLCFFVGLNGQCFMILGELLPNRVDAVYSKIAFSKLLIAVWLV